MICQNLITVMNGLKSRPNPNLLNDEAFLEPLSPPRPNGGSDPFSCGKTSILPMLTAREPSNIYTGVRLISQHIYRTNTRCILNYINCGETDACMGRRKRGHGGNIFECTWVMHSILRGSRPCRACSHAIPY